MAHRAELYSFFVRAARRPRSQRRFFGDARLIGQSVSDGFADMLQAVSEVVEVDDAPRPHLTHTRPFVLDGDASSDCHAAIFAHRRYGERAKLYRGPGTDVVRIEPEHGHEIEIGAVFSVPPMSDTGHLVLHNPHQRSIRGPLQRELKRLFRSRFGLYFEMYPTVPRALIRGALNEGFGTLEWHRSGPQSTGNLFGGMSWMTSAASSGRLVHQLKPRRGIRFDSADLAVLIDHAYDEQRDHTDLLPEEFGDDDQLQVEIFIGGQKKKVLIDNVKASFARALSTPLSVPREATMEVICRLLVEHLPYADDEN